MRIHEFYVKRSKNSNRPNCHVALTKCDYFHSKQVEMNKHENLFSFLKTFHTILLSTIAHLGGQGCDSPQRSPNTMKAYINE